MNEGQLPETARPDPAQCRGNFEVSLEHKEKLGTLLAPLPGDTGGFVPVYLALPRPNTSSPHLIYQKATGSMGLLGMR